MDTGSRLYVADMPYHLVLPISLVAAAVPEADAAAPQTDLTQVPAPVLILLLLLGVAYILIGWRLAVLQVVIATTIVLGVAGYELGKLAGQPWVPPTAGVVGAVLGLLLGRLVYRLGGALNGAVALGLLGALPGALLQLPPWIIIGGIVVGSVLGLILGWIYVRHCDAILTALGGGLLVGTSSGALLIAHGGQQELLAIAIGAALGLAGAVFGMFFQLRSLKTRPPPRRTGTQRTRSRQVRDQGSTDHR